MVSALLLALWLRQNPATPPPATPTKADLAVGKWKALPPADGPERFWYWTLDIREDGTFHQHRDLRIMVNILGDGSGTWRREPGGVRLDGQADESFDDGYGKSRKKIPINDLLIEKEGRLIIRQSLSGEKPDPSMDLVFRRVASLERDPEPPPPPPDKRAVAIWAACRRTYRSFTSYRATGSGVHPGERNRPLNARFTLSYTRASGLFLEIKDAGIAYEVRASATRSSLHSAGLSIPYDVTGKWEWVFDHLEGLTALDYRLLAEMLLLPTSIKSSHYLDLRYAGERVVDGVTCDEVSFRTNHGSEGIASIAKRSRLLLQVSYDRRAFRLRIRGSGSPAPSAR